MCLHASADVSRDTSARRRHCVFHGPRNGVNMIKFPDLYRDALHKQISNSLTVRDAARRFRYRS